jgi:hypothetical protein
MQAQHKTDDDLLLCYLNTLGWQSTEGAANSPIHQLFYHRLVGGRLERFYGSLPGKSGSDTSIALPDREHSMQWVRTRRWEINGQLYNRTLDDLINEAIVLLKPGQNAATIIGHGDAHNGNVFFRADDPPRLLYFDPAFAGRHHPLLDLAKPVFHNAFAMWMYFPEIMGDQTRITLSYDADMMHIEHNYVLPPIRHMFLHSKIERVLIPILQELGRREQLRNDWRPFLKAALFCCSFLTLNLADKTRFSPEIALLGLAMSVEMGAESDGERSLIDNTLDEVEMTLR